MSQILVLKSTRISALTWQSTTPELVRIRLGTLNTPFAKHAEAHTFVSDKATWEVIDGDLPQFDEWASRDVLIQTGSRQP